METGLPSLEIPWRSFARVVRVTIRDTDDTDDTDDTALRENVLEVEW